MAKISRKQAMLNNLIANVVVAEYEYEKGEISLETFGYAYQTNKEFAIRWLPSQEWREFRESLIIKKVAALFDKSA